MKSSVNAQPCPVCQSGSRVVRRLDESMLRRALSDFVGSAVPPHLQVGDYNMRSCETCTLEFADPMRPADDAFYLWLDSNMPYYVGSRWEWKKSRELILDATSSEEVDILEIGAGDGKFLQTLQADRRLRLCALERSAEAAQRLVDQGIEAYESAVADTALRDRRFDFVVAFHCIEHVPDPLATLHSAALRLKPGGKVLFSVPYSPMYFERVWFDALNHPPHHMTRWNQTALAYLAKRTSMSHRLLLPAALPARRRSIYSLALAQLGPLWYKREWWWRAQPLFHPLAFIREFLMQKKREHVNGRPAADVVLVEMTPTTVQSA